MLLKLGKRTLISAAVLSILILIGVGVVNVFYSVPEQTLLYTPSECKDYCARGLERNYLEGFLEGMQTDPYREIALSIVKEYREDKVLRNVKQSERVTKFLKMNLKEKFWKSMNSKEKQEFDKALPLTPVPTYLPEDNRSLDNIPIIFVGEVERLQKEYKKMTAKEKWEFLKAFPPPDVKDKK
jgi:hypothetical protein